MRFTDVSPQSGPYFSERHPSRGAALGDYDNDGDLDLAVNMNNAPAVLLRNDGGNLNHWIAVRLQGTTSNRDGVDAVVTVTAGGSARMAERRAGEGFASSGDPRLFFGLGAIATVERVSVQWPSGTRDVLTDVATDQVLVIVEGSHAPAP